jgi:hypothetical protein
LLYDPGAPGIHKITLSAPASLPADYSLALPVSAPAASQIMQSDALGNLSWTSMSAAVTSFLSGSANAPGWAVTGNTNTGLFSPASNTISLSAGGLEGLRVNTSGGATDYIAVTPGGVSSTQISTSGTDANVDLKIAPKGAGNTIFANGNVGIGTTTPNSNFLLDISGRTHIRASNSGAIVPVLTLDNDTAGGSAGAGPGLSFVSAIFTNMGSIGAAFQNNADNNNTYLSFANVTGGVLSEKMRVNNVGYVGIGTTTPSAKLDVNGKFILEASTPGSGYAGFAAPASMTTSTIWTLPAADGASGAALATNGSGILSWIAAAAAPTSFSAGSAAAPGWSVVGNTNTGLFSAASNTLSISAGGIEGLRVNTAGGALDYVAVTPGGVSSTQISTAGTDANVDLKIAPKGAGNLLLANGNLGLGTSTPSTKLEVNGDIRLTAAGNRLGFGGNNEAIRGSPGSYVSLMTNAADRFIVNYGGAWQFTDEAANEKMRLTYTGNLGIGTTSPASRLEIQGGAFTAGPQSASAANGGEIRMRGLAANGSQYVAFRAPDVVAASTTWTLPAADGASGTTLSTNGSGILSWAVAAAAPTTFLPGSAAAPGWSVSGNTNTGLFQAASNTLSIATGGIEALRANYVAGAINYASVSPGVASAGVTYGVGGSDANINLNLTPKGTGYVSVTGNLALNAVPTFNTILQGRLDQNNLTQILFQNFTAGASAGTGLNLTSDTTSIKATAYSSVNSTVFDSYSQSGMTKLAFGATSRAYIGNTASVPLHFMTNNTSQLIIDGIGNVGVGTTSPNAKLDINGKFILEASTPGSGYAGFAAPASMATSTVWTLPAADGASGTTLSTNGSGILSWAVAAAAPTSFLSGSAAAPGWAVTGNTNTGLFSAASNTISIATGGFEGLRVNQASGSDYVTVTPGGASTTSIGVAGVDTNVDLNLAPKGSGNTIFSSGKVGIGTTAPLALLDVRGGIAMTGILSNSGSGTNGLGVDTSGRTTITGGNAGSAEVFSVANTSGASGAVVALNLNHAASTGASIVETQGAAGFNTLAFSNNVSGTLAERMRIDGATGYVGIGTTSPNAKLDINGKFILEASTPGSGYAGFAAPASMATSTVWTLPAADGASGTVLSTSGSGNLSWANALLSGGTLLGGFGSVSAPSYSFSAETSTGMYRPASGVVGFATNGYDSFRISQASTASTGDYVAVTPGGVSTTYLGTAGSNTSVDLRIAPKGSGNTVFMNGNVGIGTTAPAASLDINGPFRGSISIKDTATNAFVASSINFANDGVGAASLYYGSSIYGAWGGPNSFNIVNTVSAPILFATNNTSRMYIGGSSGYVGIGTTTPNAKLDVNGKFILEASTPGNGYAGFAAPASMASANVIWTLPAADGASGTMLSTSGTGILSWAAAAAAPTTFLPGLASAPGWAVSGNINTGLFQAASNTLSFATGGFEALRVNQASGSDYFTVSPGGASSTSIGVAGVDANVDLKINPKGSGNTIFSTGSVGIGTTQPASTLDVNGNVYVSSTAGSNVAPVKISFNSASPYNRMDLDGGYSGFQSGNGKKAAIESYWGIEIQGNRQAALTTVYTVGGGADPSLTVIGGQAAAPVVEFRGLASQTGDFFDVTANAASTGNIFRVDSNGNVGIGTTAAHAHLQLPAGVSTPSGAPLLFMAGPVLAVPASGALEYDGTNLFITDSTSTRRTIATTGGSGSFAAGNAGAPGWSVTGNTTSGLFQAASNTISLATNGLEGFRINTASSSTDYIAVTPGGVSSTTIGVAGSDANVDIKLAPKGSGNTVIASGNVGIGTAAPGYLLDIAGSAHSQSLTVDVASASQNAIISLKGRDGANTASTATILADFNGGLKIQPSTNENKIYLNDSGGTTTMIVNAGNVGIGTTVPGAPLEVSGAVRVGIGAASTPTLNFTGDTTTGLYEGGAGVIGFAANGISYATMGGANGLNVSGSITGAGRISSNSANGNIYAPTNASYNTPDQNTTAGTIRVYNTSNGDNKGTYYLMRVGNTAAVAQYGYIGAVATTGAGSYSPSTVFGVSNGASSYAEMMRIDPAGNVGIGTTTPSAKLDLNGKFVLEASTPGSGFAGFAAPASMATASVIWTLPTADGASGTVLATSGAGVLSWVSSLVSGGTLLAANGSAASPSHSFTSETTTGMYKPASGTIGFSNGAVQSLAINYVAGAPDYISISPGGVSTVTLAAGGTDANIDLKIAPKGVGNIILSSGNVGIGTTTPTFPLDVTYSSGNGIKIQGNTGGVAGELTLDNLSGTAGSGSTLSFSTNAGAVPLSSISGIRGVGANDGIMTFTTKNNASGSIERMRIDNSGNVGIGTTAPAAKFDVGTPSQGSTAIIAEASGVVYYKVVNPPNTASLTSYNAASAVEYVGADSSTHRSINAGGTVNASGADFAEWVEWPDSFGAKPEMGAVIHYKGATAVVSSPATAAFIGNDVKDSTHSILIAFAGQLPVLVGGIVHEGDLIVAGNDGTGFAISKDKITLALSKKVVGTAWQGSDDPSLKRINVAVGLGIGGNGAHDIASLKSKMQSEKVAKDLEIQKLKQENADMKARLEKIEKMLDSNPGKSGN